MWALAVWIEGTRVIEDTIPRNWIKGKYVYWPTGVNAIQAMEEERHVEENWQRFDLVKIKCESGKYIIIDPQ